MNHLQRRMAKALNTNIRDAHDEYLENYKNPDDWLYASLSQLPLRVVDKHGSDDDLDWDVECPNCGAIVNYGEHLFMLSGSFYCSTDGCREKLLERRNGRNSIS